MIPRVCSNKSRLTIQGKSARCAFLALHIAALTVPAGAATQGASHPEPSDIVVSARAAKLGERVKGVVQTLTPPTDNQMIARWTGSLCFSIDGLSPPQRSVFEQSLTAVARTTRLRPKFSRRCPSGVSIIFTDDGPAMIAAMEARHMTGIADFARQTGAFTPASPIHWTSGSGLRGSAGEAALSFSIPNGNTHAAAPSTHGSPPSRLRQGGTMVLQSMLVIVDGSKIAGASNGDVASYLSMIIYGNVRNDVRQVGERSILNLFADGPPSRKITGSLSLWDQAYLSSLYNGDANVSYQQAIDQIEGRMVRDLTRVGNPDEAPPF